MPATTGQGLGSRYSALPRPCNQVGRAASRVKVGPLPILAYWRLLTVFISADVVRSTTRVAPTCGLTSILNCVVVDRSVVSRPVRL